MPLVTPADLARHLPHEDFDDDVAASAIRLVSGWLLDASGLAVLPEPAADPTPDFLWSAALELAGLVITNPELLASRGTGPVSRSWPAFLARDSILARVRAHYQSPTGGGAARGQAWGDFPPPAPWPDPPSVR